MATALVKKLFPGCTVRTGKRKRSIRFYAMVKGNRFVGNSTLPDSMAIDPKGRPTAALREEFARWRISQEQERLGPGNIGLRIPSIKELIETYEKIAWARHDNPAFGNPASRTITTAIQNYNYCVSASKLAWTRPYTELFDIHMLRNIFETLSSRRTKYDTVAKPITAWTYLQSLRSVTAVWAIPKYYDLGLDVKGPRLDAVDVGVAKKPPKYKSLSEKQKDKIMTWYSTVEEKLGRECRIVALLMLKLGMRPCDCERMTVDNFPVKGGKRHLEYSPIKTFARSGRSVSVAIAPAIWEELAALVGDDLATGAKFVKSPRTTMTKLNMSLRYACDMPLEEGWDKAAYELRKLCYDQIWHDPHLGPAVAVALSGENRSTLESYYADPYSTDAVIGA